MRRGGISRLVSAGFETNTDSPQGASPRAGGGQLSVHYWLVVFETAYE